MEADASATANGRYVEVRLHDEALNVTVFLEEQEADRLAAQMFSAAENLRVRAAGRAARAARAAGKRAA